MLLYLLLELINVDLFGLVLLYGLMHDLYEHARLPKAEAYEKGKDGRLDPPGAHAVVLEQ